MATELPRPGVEVVQEFASASPTIVTPTLVPCVIAPFFEVIEALKSDGTTNPDAKLSSLYEQLEQTILQSSFPSPRHNIDEVDVLEDSIRLFFDFGGALRELSRTSAFLTSFLDPAIATQPYVAGTVTEGSTTGGYDVDGRTIILHLDSHTALPPTSGTLPTSKNVTLTFAATTPGGRLTLDEIVEQINALVPGLASRSVAGSSGCLKLTSTRFGAGASVVVRKQGSANTGTDRLGFSAADDTIAVGSGFYAVDDSDGDATSPRLKIYAGNVQGLVGTLGAAVIVPPSFLDANILAGDDLIADGIAIGQVAVVESDLLTMEVEQNIISQDAKFAPRRVWVEANDLVYPAPGASEAATLTGTAQAAAASAAFVVPQGPFVGTASPSESISVNVVVAGVAQPTETVSSGAGNWVALAATVTDINSQATGFEVYQSNDVGDEVPTAIATHLGFRTRPTNKGSGGALTITASTVPAALGFSSLPLGDIGEDIRFKPGAPAFKVSAAPVTSAVEAETTIYTPTVLGVAKSAETIAWGAGLATLAAVVTDWNSKAKYTEAYKATVAGVESATGTYFAIRTKGENVGATAIINKTGGTDTVTVPSGSTPGTATDLNGKTFQWSLDQNPKVWSVTLQRDQDDNGTSLASIITKINALTPGIAGESDDSPPALELTSNKVGEASKLTIGSGTGNTILGFTPAQNDVGNGRPAPDLAVDVGGNVIVQSQILRDGLTGIPFNPGFAPVILSYKGLRLDLSPDADSPALLTINDISTLEEAADPVSTDNPGALMAYLALLNAPTVTVSAIGVPEVSADAPDGTPLGYAKCAEFLENEEVYALATASHLSTVHQTFLTHVNVMSEPEQKGERIYFFNPVIPDRANPTLLGSGTDLNTTATANECTLEVNIAPALIAAGIDPNLDINPTTGAIEHELYLDIGDDDKYYLIQKVTAGTTLTLRTSFSAGDGNDDAFYSSDAFPTTVISDDWTVAIRGEQLLTPGTTKPDRNRIAETVQASAQAYGFRRGFYVFPDQVAINVTGLEQVVPGYYGTGCIVGMVGQLPPQQGFTNYPMTGLTRPVGSSGFFTNKQMNIMAAGGVYILIQDAQGAPVICRHQLSTNTTSIETRELSITKVVDFTAKFMRAGLRNFIGRSNITQGFLDNLSTVVQGQLNFLVEGTILIGADINNLIQDADAPDTVLIDVTLDVPFPCNYIRLTLII
jgi:hypothetical protein